ncbi:MAG: UDP-N-acetylmuramoyl-tripeptide--D-alanyl-D-alanine ligase [Thiobacillus sp.]|nr:UDP-N-acetylmuramoyl-tripeptide--D-alanyl-D-alanine ligase [Thiobacillus sp.]
MRLHEAASALQASAVGPDVEFTTVSTDSRNLPAGALFVALRGGRYDGHHFATRAIGQGAGAVMVEASAGLDVSPAIVVKDTRLALGQLAAWHRSQLPARVMAITGSNGKTTVKEMLAGILNAYAGEAAVLATSGNFNNEIGMPLTLLRLAPEHRYAVLEMGMNHPGELDYLSRLASPDAALVNNALRAHLEGLGTVEAVAHAKGEIYNGLKADGVALVCADDVHAELWREMAGDRRVVTFGVKHGDVRADYRLGDFGAELTLHTPSGSVAATLNVPGLHNVRNAVAAAAAAWVLEVPPADIARGLALFAGVKGRLQAHPCILGARLLDDTYNANPDSVTAAIAVLAAQKGTRILVLGDMGELGPNAVELHREIGAAAKQAGLDRLLCLGDLSIEAVKAFGEGGMHFERIEELLAEVENALGPDATVLVKGSRFMKMERVVNSFVEAHVCS